MDRVTILIAILCLALAALCAVWLWRSVRRNRDSGLREPCPLAFFDERGEPVDDLTTVVIRGAWENGGCFMARIDENGIVHTSDDGSLWTSDGGKA
jgi:hypothetical protein